ncbi:hypothetical protein M758_6G120500 [Ceratodon purpureus]|nr:hypothetical protein M758_6G120500 [Ceratodon purpureus]
MDYKEESVNIFLDDDDLFGIPPTTNAHESTFAPNIDWEGQGLTHWFDDSIDAQEAAGVGLDDPYRFRLADEDETGVGYDVNLWSGIEAPTVLSQSRSQLDHDLARYLREVEDPHSEGQTVSISAADMLQLPLMRTHHQPHADAIPTSSGDSAHFTVQETGDSGHRDAEDEQELEFVSSEADSVELAIEILSDGVTSISLGDESDEDSLQEIVPYKKRRSSSYSSNSAELYKVAHEMAQMGAGHAAREKMMYEWLHKSESTVIIPDEAKREEMERLAWGHGPIDVLQPMEVRQIPGDSRWAEQLLNLCAAAIASRNIGRTQHLMWVLNELASFTGDGNQRLAAYGLKALFCKITGGKEAAATWMRPFHHQEKTLGPKAVHRALVTFHEFNLWHQVAYTVTNETLLEVFAGKSHLHIVDVGIIKGLQWPILIDALANRQGGPPSKLRITTIRHQNADAKMLNNQVDKESADFMSRLETFAKVLGLNCELEMFVGPLESIKKEDLKLHDGEVLAVCCQFRLHRLSNLVSPKSHHNPNPSQLCPRDTFLEFMATLRPSVLVISENDVDMLSENFLTRFKEVVAFWWVFFESTHKAFKGREPEAQQIVEYEGAMIMLNGIACEGAERIERNDRHDNWMSRIRRVGFAPMCISEDTKKTVSVLLQNTGSEHYGISYSHNTNCVNLSWKNQPVNFTSLWKAPSCSRKLCKCNMLHD